MYRRGKAIAMIAAGACVLCAWYCPVQAADKAQPQKAAEASKAKVIDAGTGVGTNHPEYEEGLACNNCHEIKLDANTSATQVWLSGESPGRKAGEGVMPKERVWQEVVKLIGGKKLESKTFVLGTCMNNTPLTTTAEFTLDSEKKVLYGFHEMGTEKLVHIKNNPKVSLNWHQEFESFSDFRCCQIRGHAELLDGANKEFEQVLIELLPYEAGARVPPEATPQQREERLKGFRESLKKGFVITKITIDMATLASIDFTKEGFRRYQRWTR
jgi:nitroimidazol reductase NimA-like FMN-containing flavoprotein (pyridoxamine 5'-phosphate oxidase superfamily)